jgi:hypothetical protein
LRKKADNIRNVVLFGAGAVGMDTFRQLQKVPVSVKAFLDNLKPNNSRYMRVPVFRTNSAPASLDRSLPVIICVWRADIPPSSVKETLKNAGWTNVMTMAAFIRMNFDEFADFYWGTNKGFYDSPEALRQISVVSGIWADDTSENTFSYLLNLT